MNLISFTISDSKGRMVALHIINVTEANVNSFVYFRKSRNLLYVTLDVILDVTHNKSANGR